MKVMSSGAKENRHRINIVELYSFGSFVSFILRSGEEVAALAAGTAAAWRWRRDVLGMKSESGRT
ncbi:hypothetical protein E2C01_102841 [Portunus trituberculatus]|uniref:Uncharacterized protein n=1 Tax=Portunus trituberculatus TaxID=210409 RepID=A0A5B7KIP0_PORTR|nr:hypothetical protein [Portunus trituberculatus]